MKLSKRQPAEKLKEKERVRTGEGIPETVKEDGQDSWQANPKEDLQKVTKLKEDLEEDLKKALKNSKKAKK